MSDQISLEQLSQLSGEPRGRLEDWRSRGLIGRGPDGSLTVLDRESVRLVQMCLRRGITIDAIAEADRLHHLIERYFDIVAPDTSGAKYSVAEVAQMSGIDLEVAGKIWMAVCGPSALEQALNDEDAEAFRVFKRLLDIGFTEEALIEGSRVYLDSLSRVAEMEAKLFHFNVMKRLRGQGLSGLALEEQLKRAIESAGPILEPTVLYFHRKGWGKAVREDIVMHMAAAAGLAVYGEVPGELARAVMFVDLASFTPMTEAMGDTEAARVLERFSAIVREAAGQWDGRIVKQIGDAFMLVFHEPRSALACALEVEQRTSAEPQFPAARSGVHWGTVLYREGDYVGSIVNIASRLSVAAERHQVIVSEEVRKEAHDLPDVEFVHLGKRRLKGLPSGIELFEARSASDVSASKAIDPVCGMEMGEGEVAARLTLDGVDRAFCSEDCLRKFVAAPEQYD